MDIDRSHTSTCLMKRQLQILSHNYWLYISFTISDLDTILFIYFQNGILSVFNFIVAVAAGLLCEKVGRRRLFLTSTIG
jgi:hypothetical protein